MRIYAIEIDYGYNAILQRPDDDPQPATTRNTTRLHAFTHALMHARTHACASACTLTVIRSCSHKRAYIGSFRPRSSRFR
eukprot:6183676-Pleurochrysis_carterae.AAC.1